jgi:hypothetical protein
MRQPWGFVATNSCANGEEARKWEAAGYTPLGLASDAALIGHGMTQQLADAREVEETEVVWD